MKKEKLSDEKKQIDERFQPEITEIEDKLAKANLELKNGLESKDEKRIVEARRVRDEIDGELTKKVEEKNSEMQKIATREDSINSKS